MTLHLALWVWWSRGHVEEVLGKDPCPEEVCSLNGKQDGPTTRSRQISSQQRSTLRADATGAEVPLSKEMPMGGVLPTARGQVQTLTRHRWFFAQTVVVRAEPDLPHPPSGAAPARAGPKTQIPKSRKRQHPIPTAGISLPSHQPFICEKWPRTQDQRAESL